MSKMYQQAIKELEQVKSVEEWNAVRSKYVKLLTQQELGKIDGEGLIVKVLGKDNQ